MDHTINDKYEQSISRGIDPVIVIQPHVSNLVHTTAFWINLAQNSDKKNRKYNTKGFIQKRLYMLVFLKALRHSWSIKSPSQTILFYHQIFYLSMAFNYSRRYFHPGVLWYFESHGILTQGSIFFHGILNTLTENWTLPVW